MTTGKMIRNFSVLALGLGLLGACDSDVASRSDGTRVADRTTIDRPADRSALDRPATRTEPRVGQLDDETITSQVKARLADQNAAGVDVETNAGVVQLSGSVPTADAKARAAQAARAVSGVKDVVNRISVQAG